MDEYIDWLATTRAWLYVHEPDLLEEVYSGKRKASYLDRMVHLPALHPRPSRAETWTERATPPAGDPRLAGMEPDPAA